MTEEQWLTGDESQKMLAFLQGKASDRSLRLFACTCCRSFWHLLTDGRSRRAVEIAERYADEEADDEDLRRAMIGAENVAEALSASVVTVAQEAQASAALAALFVTSTGEKAADYSASNACSAAFHAATAAHAPSAARARVAERTRQTHLLRDIFGNPFRPISVAPGWLGWNDAAVVRLARAAYEKRTLPAGTLENVRLAILADALEEAGCTDEQIPTHLRRGGEHYRGCFVLDALLGKG